MLIRKNNGGGIGVQFDGVKRDVRDGGHVHYWLGGGRGSGKSSFVSGEIVRGVALEDGANAVVIRKVGSTLRQSVYGQVGWAVDMQGGEEQWRFGITPLEAEHLDSGRRIIFRGADEPRKLRSVKFKRGYCRYIWFEEADEFGDAGEIRSILQSLMRGGERFCVFYTFNPPKMRNHWLNKHLVQIKGGEGDSLVHHSTYEGVPRGWLGEQFFVEAQRLRELNPLAYAHEYMGEAIGALGEVFSNLVLERLGDDVIRGFERVWEGIDWGYAKDPFAWVRVSYDRKRRVLYMFDEVVGTGLSNRAAAEIVKERGGRCIVADSSEPKSISEFKSLGFKIRAARKGAGSLAVGMKFLTCEVEKIVIDPVRCPTAAREFGEYAYSADGGYADKNNHTIDAVRYSLETEMGGGYDQRRSGVLTVR